MSLSFFSMISYSGTKVFRSTPIPLDGRSRTCPIDAFTTKSSPRYLLIVLALAGDSTITRLFLAVFLAIDPSIRSTVLSAVVCQTFTLRVVIRPCNRRSPPQKGRHYGEPSPACQADAPRRHPILRPLSGRVRAHTNLFIYGVYAANTVRFSNIFCIISTNATSPAEQTHPYSGLPLQWQAASKRVSSQPFMSDRLVWSILGTVIIARQFTDGVIGFARRSSYVAV